MSTNIDFGHIIPISTVDWYKKSSCTIFFNKCPFRCLWCQNHKLLKKTNIVDIDIVKNKIEESMDFINGVVFSGGEPTLQEKALDALMRFSKEDGLLTGVQTNGYYPLVLEKLIENDIIDKIFLDIKASPSNVERYRLITGSNDANEKVLESFKIVNMSHVESEIRATVFRSFIGDIFDIAQFLGENNYKGAFVLQTGIPNNAPEGDIRKEIRIENIEMKIIAKKIANETGIVVKCA